jgi:ABC-type multidrug transport system fused ATPase/permease subunit
MGAFDIVKQAIKSVAIVVLLFLSVHLVANGTMGPGMAITIVLLFQAMVVPVESVYRFIDELSAAVAKIKTFRELDSQGEDPIFAVPDAPVTAFAGNLVCFEHVQVQSPETGETLSAVEHVSIDASSITGVKGVSGSGKSSLLRALMGYYPYSGSIQLFGVPANMVSRSQLAEFIAFIPQANHFFVGSVRDNLVYGLNYRPSDSQLKEALTKACLPELDLDMDLEEGAVGLSGGEATRLKLARAFLRYPQLFILDEPDTGLDSDTTKTALNNLLEYAHEVGAGVIFISHKEGVQSLCNSHVLVHKQLTTRAA